MNVLMLSTDEKIFETGTQVRTRMKDYGSIVHNLHILVFTRNERKFEKISDNVFVYPVFFKGFFSARSNSYKVARQIKDSIDLVSSQDAFELGLFARRIAKKLDAKVQIQVHTDIFSEYFLMESKKNRIRSLLAKINIPKVDCIRVVTKRVKDEIHDKFGVPYNKVQVLPVYTYVERRERTNYIKEKYKDFDNHLLVISRLEVEKNIEMAIRAMKNIIPRFPKTVLVIVGEGSNRKRLEKLVKDLHLSANVIFEGWQDKVSDYLSSADIYIHVANYEGYGMTLVEAALNQCPIISTDVGLVGDVLDKESVAVIPVGGQNELIRAIERMLKMPDIGRLLAKNAIERVKTLPNKEEYLARYKELLEKCVS